MSMPSFPPNGADMTREEALTMIIASIAMEELALSHILNAEGEKLQYILGTLPGTASCAGPKEILEVNRSITALLEAVMQNQMLLKNKLDRALEACPPPVPPDPPACGSCPCTGPCGPSCGGGPCPGHCRPACPPPCKPAPCRKSALQLAGQRAGQVWSRDCRLPWRQLVQRGENIRWDEQHPSQILLNPQKAYAVQYTLNIRTIRPAAETGTVIIRQTPCGAFTETLPLHFTTERCANTLQTLQYTAMLYPRMECEGEAEVSLVLEGRSAICVERAILNVIEL